MSTAVTKPSKILKGMTTTVRAHLDAVERARELYLGQMKRAEVEYFDRIKRATELIAGVETDAAEEAEEAGPVDGPTQATE
jgi:hypothetical protein